MPELIAGIDEVGRGCLAGPVAAAAVILNPAMPIYNLKDSKLLSPNKREELSLQIKEKALSWSIALVWQNRIDEINILQATLEAMAKASAHLKVIPSHLYIDGNKTIPIHVLRREWLSKDLPDQKAIVKGDKLNKAIAAASILAKVFRDKLMVLLSKKWPQYNFSKHKGYGTKEHLLALRKYGSCPLHRLSFHGVSNIREKDDPERLRLI